jgi:hypothetical protein
MTSNVTGAVEISSSVNGATLQFKECQEEKEENKLSESI